MRFKKFARLSVIACSLLLACSLGVQSPVITAGAASNASEKVDQLEDRLDELQSDADKINADIEALKEDKSKKEQLKSQLQRKIANTQEQISACNEEINSLDAEIEQQEQQIADKNAELEKNKELFKQRIRAMYMSGGNSDLLMLLGADDFADYLSRAELSRSVSEHDQQLMEDIATAISEIEAAKSAVQEKKDERTEAKKTLAAKQKDLKAEMEEVSQLIDEIDDKTEELEESSDEAQAAMQQVMDDLEQARADKAIQDEIDRINAEREEQKKQEEADKNQGESTGSGGSGSSSSGGMSSGMFLWPVNGSYTITSPYGYRIHPISGVSKLHKGTDISGGGINGKPILAIEDGVVLLAGYNAGGYGNYVIINHGTLGDGNSYESLYGHMMNYVVSAGQTVRKGQVIGYVGSTGASTGPHLHLEIHRNGSLTDPMSYYDRLG